MSKSSIHTECAFAHSGQCDCDSNGSKGVRVTPQCRIVAAGPQRDWSACYRPRNRSGNWRSLSQASIDSCPAGRASRGGTRHAVPEPEARKTHWCRTRRPSPPTASRTIPRAFDPSNRSWLRSASAEYPASPGLRQCSRSGASESTVPKGPVGDSASQRSCPSTAWATSCGSGRGTVHFDGDAAAEKMHRQHEKPFAGASVYENAIHARQRTLADARPLAGLQVWTRGSRQFGVHEGADGIDLDFRDLSWTAVLSSQHADQPSRFEQLHIARAAQHVAHKQIARKQWAA